MSDQWKLVPVKPTPEMVDALWDALPKGFSFQNCTPIGVIASIIDAAPIPTQGADARPVAIYQVRYFGSGDWRDVSEAEYQHARMHPDMRDRIVYATRDAAPIPSDCDVRKILLRVVPGDGDGLEVYAKMCRK